MTDVMVAGFGLAALWSLLSLFVRFFMLSILLFLVVRPACWQYVLIESLISSHWCANFSGGCERMICSIAELCFLDLRSDELKRHIGDLLFLLRESERMRARWSESAPILWVVREKEGRIVGEMKM